MDYDRRYAARYRRVFQGMSLDQAKQVLGFPPGYAPSSAEVTKAYRMKTVENHPDKGGRHEVQVDLNVARDVLQGKRLEDRYQPVSWGHAGPVVDPDAARRVEEERQRNQALHTISKWKNLAQNAAQSAINGTDLIGYRINLGAFLDGEYRGMLDRIQEDIESVESHNAGLQKAQALVHMLTGMSHRLAGRFHKIVKMNGDAHAAQIGLGGEYLTWYSVAAIYLEMKKFFAAYNEFDKVDGQLQALVVTSEQVPHAWVDLAGDVRGVVVSFRNDFRGYSDHALNKFAEVMRQAYDEITKLPFNIKHVGWKTWGVPNDFEAAEKVVMATAAN